MIVNRIKHNNIPAILWGEESSRLIIAAHGSQSSKLDSCIWILAEEAVARGYQVLSFDFPQHGERIYETEPCMVQECVRELKDFLSFGRQRADKISVFGCSMGAYFSLLAYEKEQLENVFFLSPVTDMKRIIHNIMELTHVSEAEFQEKKIIKNPIETLYWEYYCYVKDHPIAAWNHPTSILYGEHDTICEYDYIKSFAEKFRCNLEVQEGGEHWFHTPDELEYFRLWLRRKLNKQ